MEYIGRACAPYPPTPFPKSGREVVVTGSHNIGCRLRDSQSNLTGPAHVEWTAPEEDHEVSFYYERKPPKVLIMEIRSL